MPRLARVVIPGIPHHILQRGNRRLRTFFQTKDYREYLRLMATWCRQEGVEIWAYCLMPNHTHLIAVPEREDSLRRGMGEAHRRYTRYINFQKGWRGHLWQERFHSYPLDERHLYQAALYVELNPVKARMVKRPEAYRWSSAGVHLGKREDSMVRERSLGVSPKDWRGLLNEGMEAVEAREVERHLRTGRPLGSPAFLKRLENITGRTLQKKKPGPAPGGGKART